MRTALVAVEMPNGFVEGALADPATKATTEPVSFLADNALAAKDRVIVDTNDARLTNDIELRIHPTDAMSGAPVPRRGRALSAPRRRRRSKRFSSTFTETGLMPHWA